MIQDTQADARPSRLASLAARMGQGVSQPSILTLAGLSALAGLCLMVSLHWVVSGFLHSRKVVEVPDVAGKSLEQALDLLSPLELAIAKEGVQYDDRLPPGAILRQAPPAGFNVREGKIVRVTLSSGGEVAFVPDLVAIALTEAQNRLRAAGLVLGAVSQSYSLESPVGIVLMQNPVSGGSTRPGTMVDLKVSKGPPPQGVVLMPAFMNQPIETARAWADAQKISPEVKEESSSVFSPGTVMRQSPAPDTPVNEKTLLTFVVAVSTVPVSVPIHP
ncbi:MAG: PASTA domain-containing protein [Elusimicrobia bacterium]|nr:PASTA domain-containing protein [Elusimicrobiota bacterium]MBP9127727.1 PASTA domain-containing protein [Elusimicrobiota bacterium]